MVFSLEYTSQIWIILIGFWALNQLPQPLQYIKLLTDGPAREPPHLWKYLKHNRILAITFIFLTLSHLGRGEFRPPPPRFSLITPLTPQGIKMKFSSLILHL